MAGMASIFERAFLQAVKRRQIRRPTRLKSTIQSFSEAFYSQSTNNRNVHSVVRDSSHQHDESLNESFGRKKKGGLSKDMSKSLMQHGFGVIPECKSPIGSRLLMIRARTFSGSRSRKSTTATRRCCRIKRHSDQCTRQTKTVCSITETTSGFEKTLENQQHRSPSGYSSRPSRQNLSHCVH